MTPTTSSAPKRRKRCSPTRTSSGTGKGRAPHPCGTIPRSFGCLPAVYSEPRLGDQMQMYENVLETLGNTPLVKLGRFFSGPATLAAKVEFFNPGGSVKDRIGIAMIEAGETSGQLKPGGTIVEPT